MYFGQTVNYTTRSQEHCRALKNVKHHNFFLQRCFNKKQEFCIFPVESCNNDDLNIREIFWINYHNTNNKVYGYNLTSGGNSLYKRNIESIKKMADSRRGNPGSLKGKTQSEEHKLKRSLITKGISKPMSEETLLKLKSARLLKKGTRQKGKKVLVTDCNTNELITFNSKREVEDFLGLKRDSLIHKFYYGKPRQILKEIAYNNFKIIR
jgi:group I intron endonuclease